MSFEGGYQSDVVQSSTNAKGGAIFITDIEPQEAFENVASKVFSSDGLVLQSCTSSTDLIKVSVLAITGFSTFKPTVLVENELVSLIQDEDQNVWTGTIEIDLNGKSFVEAIHSDGAFHRCTISNEENPIITNAFLKGGYPIGQSELKENDTFSLQVEASEPFSKIEVDNYGAAKAGNYSVSEGTSATVSISIADKGNSATVEGVRLRIENTNGTKSDWFTSDSQSSIDGVNTVILNNVKPIISIQEIRYPTNQLALKNDEKATIEHSINNYDTVSYTSNNAQLNIIEPNSFASSKEVSRNSGDYNILTNNLSIVATRNANGATGSVNIIIKIAHVAAVLSFDGNQNRLISGGNNGTEIQSHSLNVQSNQELIGVPQIVVTQGALQGQMQQIVDSMDYQQTILIHDNDEKGIHEAQLIQAVNLAGIISSSFSGNGAYEIGGFIERQLNFQEFNNESLIGTSVSDVLKIVARDKDQILMNYAPNLDDNRLTFTITQPSDIVNPNGNILHWNDEQAVNNNSTGLATILIEELP